MKRTVKTSTFAAAVLAVQAGLGLFAPSGASAAITALDLANYTLTGTYTLPGVAAAEASAVTYNWTTDTLFVLGDEGDALVEVTRTGAQVSMMALTGFADTEGLTYIGGGQFVLTEERLRNAYLLSYSAGGSVDSSTLAMADLGATVGNIGIEGISYDPRDGSFITVKEINPQEVNRNVIDFGAGTAVVTSLFTPNLGVIDLSDVQVLATVPSLTGAVDEDNLLIFSQESARLLEVDRSGNVLSQYDFSTLADSAEGVTIDANGNIYVVAENGDDPLLFELSPAPVPLPPALVLLGSALAGLAGVMRRRKA
ncbi:MAG: SdiA-regulated domain-containing protein [Gammaproteobacteria bacterium]